MTPQNIVIAFRPRSTTYSPSQPRTIPADNTHVAVACAVKPPSQMPAPASVLWYHTNEFTLGGAVESKPEIGKLAALHWRGEADSCEHGWCHRFIESRSAYRKYSISVATAPAPLTATKVDSRVSRYLLSSSNTSKPRLHQNSLLPLASCSASHRSNSAFGTLISSWVTEPSSWYTVRF